MQYFRFFTFDKFDRAMNFEKGANLLFFRHATHQEQPRGHWKQPNGSSQNNMAPKKRVKQQSAQKNPTKKSEDPDYLKKVDPILMKNIKQLTAGQSNLRIFVPMCGKTPDMLWLAEQGHAITGVEINARYIKAFFREADLEYTLRSEQFTATKKVNVYEAKGKDITLYQCDIFDYNVEVSGQFDAIWDQSAIPVVNEKGPRQLKRYTSLMQALLKPDGRHMVEVCKHGSNFVDEKMLKSLFGDKSEVRYVGNNPSFF